MYFQSQRTKIVRWRREKAIPHKQHRTERYRKRNFVSNPFFEGFYECENPPKHQLHFLNRTLICYISVSLNDSIVAFLSSNHPQFVRPLAFLAIPLHILHNEWIDEWAAEQIFFQQKWRMRYKNFDEKDSTNKSNLEYKQKTKGWKLIHSSVGEFTLQEKRLRY